MDLHVRVCWFGMKVCLVGMWVMHLQLPVQSLTPVPFDACVRNVEGCGLIADVPNPLVK